MGGHWSTGHGVTHQGYNNNINYNINKRIIMLLIMTIIILITDMKVMKTLLLFIYSTLYATNLHPMQRGQIL